MITPDTPQNPFKFLNAYQQGEEDIFFGRKKEINQLYDLVCRNRMVVVFGPSGTGKTSLVQCGLSKVFDQTDWFPLYLRRGKNYITSIAEALRENGMLLHAVDAATENVEFIVDALIALGKKKLRPVYVVLDQFEELLILGDKTEMQEVVEFIEAILHGEKSGSCNLIITIREEYIGSLEPFVKAIPDFIDARLRLKSMKEEQAREVIINSCEKFNIKIDATESVDKIIDILKDDSGISLPYLQVYLYQLWQVDFSRTYMLGMPWGYNGGYPALEFTIEEIQEFGGMKDVLFRFLEERSELIIKKLQSHSGYQPDVLDKVLNAMVTDEGTKKPLEIEREDQMVKVTTKAPKVLQEMDPGLLSLCLQELEESRIVREEKNHYELAHDKLADLIFQKRSQEQLKKAQVIQLIEHSKVDKTFLSDKQLAKYEDIIPQLELDRENAAYISRSRSRNSNRKALQILIPVTIGLILVLFQNFKLIKDNQQMSALNFFVNTVDTIGNKELALKMADHVYGLQHRSEYQDPLRGKYSALFALQVIQSRLSIMEKTVNRSFFDYGEVTISSGGDFIVVKDTSAIENSANYIIYAKNGEQIANFEKITYVYFLNHPDVLLLASFTGNGTTDPFFSNYPNHFILYNCRSKKRVAEINLVNDRLYGKGTIVVPNENEYDSYRVRYDARGNLLLPFTKANQTPPANRAVRIYRNDIPVEDIPSIYTLSISKDGKSIMTGGSGKIEVRGDDGNILVLEGATFADFTEKGSIIYVKGNQFTLCNKEGVVLKQFDIPAGFKYAYADGDETFAIIKLLSGDFYMYDFLKNEGRRYHEALLGFDFKRKVFISKAVNKSSKSVDTLLYKRDFSGNLLHTLLVKEGISQVEYNADQDNTLILTDKNKLLLIDSDLKVKSSYVLSANDTFGFCKNGRFFYYIRDQSLNLLENKTEMINLSDLEQARKWYKSTMFSETTLSTKTLEEYKLPKRNFWSFLY